MYESSKASTEDVLISQAPANDTLGARSMVDVHISLSRLKPPDAKRKRGGTQSTCETR